MKKSFWATLCLISLLGCTSSAAISKDQSSASTVSNQTVAAQPSLRVVGNVLYFFGIPPDRIRAREYKNQNAINTHYANLLTAIKKRNSVQDAHFAFNHGMRYFFTGNGRQFHNQRVMYGGVVEMAKLCPNANARLVWLEGVRFADYNSTECLNNSNPSCRGYMGVGDSYMTLWNKEMSRLCVGGK
ncbi:MAG: hypothetical protein R3F02_08100 [Thiolinea sp.]